MSIYKYTCDRIAQFKYIDIITIMSIYIKTIKWRDQKMLQVIKSILLLLCSIMGMMLIPTPYMTTGFVLAFGCFLLFALDVASNFID